MYPADSTYGWAFAGATDSIRSGAFTTGDGETPILTTSDPSYVGWHWAAGAGPGGIDAIARTYPLSSIDIGPAFFYNLPNRQKKLYVRFYYKQSKPFNANGGTSNQNWLTMLRILDAYGRGVYDMSVSPGGRIAADWENWGSGAMPLGSFNLNSVLGTWNCYEAMVDLTSPNSAHQTIWVNDVQVLDSTIAGNQVNSTGTSLPFVQFFGTINSMQSQSTAWVTMIGISTQRLGCPIATGSTATATARAATLAITQQPSSSVQSGVAFAQQPKVQLRDSTGRPVGQSGVVVTATIASGSGTLSGITATTDSSGTAAFTSLALSGAAGTYTLGFSAAGLSGATSVPITVTSAPAPPAQLRLTTQPSSSAVSGASFAQQPVVQLVDAGGNPVSQGGVTVTAAIASGGGTLGGTTSVQTNASGAAAFTNLSISGTVGARALSFSAASLAGAVSNPVLITAGPATRLVITQQPSSAAKSGIILAQQPILQLQDAWNNAVSQAGVVVTATIASGGGTLGGTTAVSTNASGVASFTGLSLSGTVGTRTLSFGAPGLVGATSTAIAVTAGAATKLTIATPAASTADSAVPPAQEPVLQLRDAWNNAVSQAGVAVTAAIGSGIGTLLGTATVTTNSAGAAGYTNLAIAGSGSYTLVFSAPGLASATSGTITVIDSTATVSSSFATPNILNNASFEGSWDGFTDWSGNPTASGVSLATDYAFSGSYSARRTWVPNPGSDVGAQMVFPIGLADRIWVRFYFRLTAPITSIMKFMRFYNSNFSTPYGGFFLQSGSGIFSAGWDAEDASIVTPIGLSEAQVIDGNWHSLEIDYWRNGDPSGYPSMAFWFDGNPVSLPDGSQVHYDCRTTSGTCNKSYWKGGRLYAGERVSSEKLGLMEWLATLNAGNTTSGQVNIDRVAISTAGRIGP